MSNEGVNQSKRRFLTGSAVVVGGVGTVFTAVPFLSSWQPSQKAKAAGAPVEVDISKLEPGQRIVAKWRGKPAWVIRRTKAHMEGLAKVTEEIRDPESAESNQPEYAKNQHRSRAENPEVVVLIGLCTHLGCSPSYEPELRPALAATLGDNWQGGFFCPCHGSKFDFSGRVYKSVPAPTNLDVPPYQYLSDNLILVGEDGGAA